MRAACNKCGTRYRIRGIEDSAINVRIRCNRCGNSFEFQSFSPCNEPKTPRGQWYFARDGDAFGPYTEGELIERYECGNLNEDTHVWTPAFDDWIPPMEHNVFATAIAVAKSEARSASDGAPRKDFNTPIEELEALPEDPLYANDDTVELETQELFEIADRRIIFHDDMFDDDVTAEANQVDDEEEMEDTAASAPAETAKDAPSKAKKRVKPQHSQKPKHLPSAGPGYPRRIPRPPKPQPKIPSPAMSNDEDTNAPRISLAERLRRLRHESGANTAEETASASSTSALSSSDGTRPVRVVTGKHAAISYDLPPRNPTPNPSTRSLSAGHDILSQEDATVEATTLGASTSHAVPRAHKPPASAKTQMLTPLEQKLAQVTSSTDASQKTSAPSRGQSKASKKTTLLSPKPLDASTLPPVETRSAPLQTDQNSPAATAQQPSTSAANQVPVAQASQSTDSGKTMLISPKDLKEAASPASKGAKDASKTMLISPKDLKEAASPASEEAKDASRTMLISPDALKKAEQEIAEKQEAQARKTDAPVAAAATTAAATGAAVTKADTAASTTAPTTQAGAATTATPASATEPKASATATPSQQPRAENRSEPPADKKKSPLVRWLAVALVLALAFALIGRWLWQSDGQDDELANVTADQEAPESIHAQWTHSAIANARPHLEVARAEAQNQANQAAETLLAQYVARQEGAQQTIHSALANAQNDATKAAEKARAAERQRTSAPAPKTTTPSAAPPAPPAPKPVTDNTANQSNSLRSAPTADNDDASSNNKRRERRLKRRNR